MSFLFFQRQCKAKASGRAPSKAQLSTLYQVECFERLWGNHLCRHSLCNVCQHIMEGQFMQVLLLIQWWWKQYWWWWWYIYNGEVYVCLSRFCLFHFFPFLDTFGAKIWEKVSRKGRNDKKCLEIWEKVSRNRRNDKKCLEMGENVFSHF